LSFFWPSLLLLNTKVDLLNDQQPDDFQPQQTPVHVDNTASYNKRFLAFVIDVFLMAIALVFFMRFLGLEPSSNDLQAAQTELAAKLAALPESKKMLLTFSPFIIFFLLHSYSLYPATSAAYTI
jgi:hypothetical protein